MVKAALPEALSSNSLQPYDGAHPFKVGSNALFWNNDLHADRTLIYIKEINESF